MNDFGQEQKPNRELSHSYIPIVSPEDKPESKSDWEMEHLHYPKKQISNIGEVYFLLSRLWPNSDNPDVVEELEEQDDVVPVITKTGVITKIQSEAMKEGYYNLSIEIESPARRRDMIGYVNITLDGQNDFYRGNLYNQTKSYEDIASYSGQPEIQAGTELNSWKWTNVRTGESVTDIMIENNPDLLAKVGVSFEFIQNREVSN